jgi:hypothetical protein
MSIRSGSRFAAMRGFLTPFVTFVLFMTVVGGTLAVNDPATLPAAPAAIAEGVPVAVAGTLLGVADGHLAVREVGAADPVAFPLGGRAEVLRDGVAVPPDALRPGDELRLSVDGSTGAVLRIDAAPVAAAPFAPSDELALFAAIGLVSGAVLLAARNRRSETISPSRQRTAGAVGRAAMAAGRGALPRTVGVRQTNRIAASS